MIDLDTELYGRRRSTRVFVIVSDGQDWSGEVSDALSLARDRDISVYVVGVGTTAGGFIPDLPPHPYEQRPPPIHSSLNRRSLRAIAEAGGGQYHEIGTESDTTIALKILSDVQQRSQLIDRQEKFAELYWSLLATAGMFLGLGTLLIRDRSRLLWQFAITAIAIVFQI